MRIGASTACAYPMNTEDSLDMLIGQGIRNFEIFFNSPSELEIKFLKKLKEKSDDAGGKFISVHPFTSGMEPLMFFSEYERRFDDMLDFYHRYFDACAYLGADILVIHGDRLPERIAESVYFERFARLSMHGKENKIRVAQENVNMHRSQSPDFLKRFRDNLGDLAYFVFDVKQSVRSGNTPKAVVEAMGDRIIHVHVNDNNQHRDCLLPGSGEMDYLQLKKLLDSFDVEADWIIEVYRKDFVNFEQIGTSARFLGKMFAIQS